MDNTISYMFKREDVTAYWDWLARQVGVESISEDARKAMLIKCGKMTLEQSMAIARESKWEDLPPALRASLKETFKCFPHELPRSHAGRHP